MMREKRLGQVIKDHRTRLHLNQRELALKLGIKPSHIASIESDRLRPSLALLNRVADELGLVKEAVFVLAHPAASGLLDSHRSRRALRQNSDQVWRNFVRNKQLLTKHGVKPRELRVLSQINFLGKIVAPTDFLFILNSIRQAIEAEKRVLE